MDEWLNGRMTMMATTATTIFDATTGTLSPKVQSLVSSRVHLGKIFKTFLRHTGGCVKRYYVNAAHTQVRSDTKGCGPAPTSSHSKDHRTTPTVPKFQAAHIGTQDSLVLI